MKNIISLMIVLFSFNTAQSQIQEKSIQDPKSSKLEDYSNALKMDLVKEHYVNAPISKPLNKDLLNIDYSYKRDAYFKLLKEDASKGTVWLKGIVDQDKTASWEHKCHKWLNEAMGYLDIKSDEAGFKFVESWTDELAFTHSKFYQTYEGHVIYNKELLLHGKASTPALMNGFLLNVDECSFSSKKALSPQEAQQRIISELKNYKEDALSIHNMGLDLKDRQWTSELVYYSLNNKDFSLVYHIQVYANAAEHYEYFIDAESGEVLDKFSTICKFHSHEHEHNCSVNRDLISSSEIIPDNANALLDGPATSNANDLNGVIRLINTYEHSNAFFLIDASRDMYNGGQSVYPNEPVGVIWTIDLNNTSPVNENSLYTHITSSNNSWNNSPEGVSAHHNAGLAYEYFKQTFNREAISGTGENILSFVNVTDEYENSMGNAFWNGLGIYYGNGDEFFDPLGKALDVAGHEMSHGVIERTANLEYRDESGALNESFADIFGVMIDRDDWTVGEEVVKTSAFPSGALRSFADPHNGAQTGNWQGGWQPKHYNERYTGQDDNGGVHINSGITNHAYYLFAQLVGRDRAEQVYYRALTNYLTRSSGFTELRYAVIQSAMDLYDNSVVQSAASSFDEVGILDANNTDFEEDFETNTGQDLLLVSDEALDNLYLFDLGSSQAIFNPLSTTDILSKPSVTDDGSRIVFVGTDNHVHLIDLDWSSSPPQAVENIISNTADWRNAVISKDGRFIALLENIADNAIIVFDLQTGDSNLFELTNPTYSSGVSTGEVQYADVMEFDHTGTNIMYDAFNSVDGNAGAFEYWDIGFVEVWNNQFDTWALGSISKLFNSLPESINIGNPSFSKNSPHIIALDIFEGSEYEILGINLETQELNSIIQNSGLSYPSYSRDDRFMVYDLDLFGYTDLAILNLNEDKISSVANSDQILLPGGKWGIWFSNGERDLSSTNELSAFASSILISPNPANDLIRVRTENKELLAQDLKLSIHDLSGRKIFNSQEYASIDDIGTLDISALNAGIYILKFQFEKGSISYKFIKR